MKILYHHRTASKDGQAVHIDEMIGALCAAGHTVIVVAPEAQAGGEFGSDPKGLLSWIRRRLPKALYELLELAYNVPEYRKLRRAVIAHRPDVLYERYNLYTLSGAWLARRFGLPFLLEVNSPIFAERDRTHGIALRRIALNSENWTWRQADRVLPVTQVLADILIDRRVARERILVIPNGIDLERFREAASPEDAKRGLGLDGKLVLGFTGFVRDWSGLEAVIDSLARPDKEDCFLLVVGDGPARAELEIRAARLGVEDRVRFTGVVARDRVRDHVAAFDIALQPAANVYASPLKLLEYMALSCAIVAPSQPNILETLTPEISGVLFDPKIPEDFERAIDRLANDSALRARLGQQARSLIDQRQLTWGANAQRVVALATTLIIERRGVSPAKAGL